MKWLVVAVAILCSQIAHAQIGLPFPGPGQGAGTLPGPPAFTYQAEANATTTSSSIAFGPATVSGASPTRLVCSTFWVFNAGGATLSAPTFNAVSATLYFLGGDGTGQNYQQYLGCAVVPTGTSITLTVQTSGSTFGAVGSFYIADSSKFVSLTPVINYGYSATSPFTVTVPTLAGGAVLAIINLEAGSAGSFTTPSSFTVTTDATFGSTTVFGSSNNVGAFSPASVSASFPTGPGSLGLAAFR